LYNQTMGSEISWIGVIAVVFSGKHSHLIMVGVKSCI
jgi:hypothetical protein